MTKVCCIRFDLALTLIRRKHLKTSEAKPSLPAPEFASLFLYLYMRTKYWSLADDAKLLKAEQLFLGITSMKDLDRCSRWTGMDKLRAR